MELAGRLSYLMEKNGTSISELARYIGVSRQSVMGWLSGSKPSYDKLAKIAEYFDQPIEYFSVKPIGHTNDMMKKYLESVSKQISVKMIPILGSIQAGYPVESFENPDGYVSSPVGKNPDNLFALKVIGDSMLPLVMEGDVIILNKITDQVNGKICAVTIDNESTLKRVKKDSTGVTLIPTNPMYPELHYSAKKAEELGFRIEGVLVQMVRNF